MDIKGKKKKKKCIYQLLLLNHFLKPIFMEQLLSDRVLLVCLFCIYIFKKFILIYIFKCYICFLLFHLFCLDSVEHFVNVVFKGAI